MNYKEDGEQSSGILMPKKNYANSFNGAHIHMVIIGESVFERVDKSVKDVMYATREDEATHPVRNVVNSGVITREKIGRCIQAVQKHFWGKSSYAIVFCVLRDNFGYGNNMKSLEIEIQTLVSDLHLDYNCPDNTISNTVYHNKFMRYSIDKWEGCQAKPRSIRLAKYVFDAMNAML